jgi:hypothetical protein
VRAGDVLRDAGRPVAYHADLARALGSIPAALMLTQLLYWSDKTTDGWVWKVERDWYYELAFTPDVLKGARKVLTALRVIEHKRDGLPAKPYYRVDMEALDQWWEQTFGPDLSGENPRTGQGESHGQGGGKSPDIPLPDIDHGIDDSQPRGEAHGFEIFWDNFPRHTDKGGARKAWAKAVKKVDADTIITAAHAFARDPNLPEPQFVPHASTWLNGERWNDGPLPPRKGQSSSRPSKLQTTFDTIDTVFDQIRGGSDAG